MSVSVLPVLGIPEVESGANLAALIKTAIELGGEELHDGDILVVTSKIVSKSEGRLIVGDDRDAAIADETVRVVARRGLTTISETQHGFVMAAAGVDASDIPLGQVALLPADPDASARALRQGLGGRIAVIISDTFGRPWRDGLIDQALGVAGIDPLHDHRGSTDSHGRPLQATVMAIADEIASASELVRGKARGVPVAIIRGLGHLVTTEDGRGAQAMVRQGESDWFRYGHRDLITSRRTIRDFTNDPVPRALIEFAIEAAITAPAPHHTHPMRFVVIESSYVKKVLLEAMEQQWRSDLRADGLNEEAIVRRIARGGLLHQAPVLIAPFLVREGAHAYPDERRRRAEERMFTLAAGAALENLLIALHGEGVGSAWVSSSIFCPEVVTEALGVDPDWEPVGLVAAGYPLGPQRPPRPRIDIASIAQFRT